MLICQLAKYHKFCTCSTMNLRANTWNEGQGKSIDSFNSVHSLVCFVHSSLKENNLLGEEKKRQPSSSHGGQLCESRTKNDSSQSQKSTKFPQRKKLEWTDCIDIMLHMALGFLLAHELPLKCNYLDLWANSMLICL